MFRTLAQQSALVALTGVAETEDCGGHVVLRCPAEPDFWDGNRIVFRRWSGDREADLAAFAAAFPSAHHVSLSWDVPDLSVQKVRDLYEGDHDVACDDVLTLSGLMAPADPVKGVTCRMIETDSDWQQLLAQQVEIGAESGLSGPTHDAYLTRRNISRRAQINDGLAAWFGAFEGARLTASMGIVTGGGIARYQEVQTAARDRRRGICAALLRHVSRWASTHQPDARQVIIAESDGAPGRLYRRAGFVLTETAVSVSRAGYAAGFVAAVT